MAVKTFIAVPKLWDNQYKEEPIAIIKIIAVKYLLTVFEKCVK
jgi:hypothetical protein